MNQLLPGGAPPRAHILVAQRDFRRQGITQRSATLWGPLGATGTARMWRGAELTPRVRKHNVLESLLPGPCSAAAFPQLRRALCPSGTIVRWVQVKLGQMCVVLAGTIPASCPALRKLVVGRQRLDTIRKNKMMGLVLFCSRSTPVVGG